MKYNSKDKVTVLVHKFLKSTDKSIIIPYHGKKLNSFMDWKKIHFIPRLYFNIVCTQILKLFPPSPFKNEAYRLLGFKIGKDVAISPGANLDSLYPSLISIGDNVIIGYGAKLMVHAYTHNNVTLGRVIVESGVLIGGWSLVLPGVVVKKNAAISCGSVVHNDIPAEMLVRGNPAKIIKKYNSRKDGKLIVNH